MFYAMKTLRDIDNPKLFHVRAIRKSPYKTLEAAKKAASKHEMGYVINEKREMVYA